MKPLIRFASLFLFLALVFLPLGSASASNGILDGQVVIGQSYTLQGDESLAGDLLVLGGTAEIQEGATVNGNVVVMGGSLILDGKVTGDVSVTGGDVILGPTAHILGDLITVGATLDAAPSARVEGQTYNTATSLLNGTSSDEPLTPDVPQVPEIVTPQYNINLDPINGLLRAFGNAFGLGILAMLVMLFLAPQAGRVAQAVISQPLMAGGVGLLVALLTPFALVLMVVTLILIPVAGLLMVTLIIASVFGWMALGLVIGQRFTRAIHQDWHPSFEAGLGTFVLTLLAAALTKIWVLNCIGWVVPFLLGLAAFGAVVMTRFGTQALPPRSTEPLPPTSPVPDPAPAPEPEASLPPVPPEEPRRRKAG